MKNDKKGEKEKEIEKKIVDGEVVDQSSEAEEPKKDEVGNDSVDGLASELESVKKEAKDHYDKLLRVMAEFDNFKKRMLKEHAENLKYGNERLILALLPIIDDFERVQDHISKDATGEVGEIFNGLVLVHKNLLKTLEGFGVTQISPDGQKFDPVEHEAISHVDSDEHEENQIISTQRKGYKLYDRIIRPAMVAVAKG